MYSIKLLVVVISLVACLATDVESQVLLFTFLSLLQLNNTLRNGSILKVTNIILINMKLKLWLMNIHSLKIK